MNVIHAVRLYLSKMVDDAGPGMKVLLMDKETTGVVSLAFSQTEMLQKEVYLFERISTSSREKMKHMKAIVFLRPTEENLYMLANELKNPKYGSYYVYFSNFVHERDIKMLAEADDQELVKDFQEYYADYFAVNQHLFTFNLVAPSKGSFWKREASLRIGQGLAALLLSLKKNPRIRYQAASDLTKALADFLKTTILQEQKLFDFPRMESSVLLLILDRRFDPITPLLNQWTYQAMVHELIGIKNNRVDLSHVPGVSKDLHQVVLSAEQDEVFRDNMFLNFGEFANNIKQLMDNYQKTFKSNQRLDSIEDMKTFAENYPQFKKMSGTVFKHVTIVSELSTLVRDHCCLEVSELEQDLVSKSDHSTHLQGIRKLLATETITDLDKVRLVLLYTLRYERNPNNDIRGLQAQLSKMVLQDRHTRVLTSISQYVAAVGRDLDIFGEKNNPIALTRRLYKGLQGVDNIYTQHTPLLSIIIENLLKGKLKDASYPYAHGIPLRDKPQELIVFFVGGVTFEEALLVHNLNKQNPGMKIIIGGTSVLNTEAFVDEVLYSTGNHPNSGTEEAKDFKLPGQL